MQACYDSCYPERGDIHFLDSNKDGEAGRGVALNPVDRITDIEGAYMTTTVQEFTRDKLPVVTVTLADSLDDVAKRMIEHDYSQLPVVDSEKKPIGIITSDSILKALNNYGVALDGLRIKHIMQKSPRLFRRDIDLLDLFDDMDSAYAFVVDEEGRLVQIITSYDTAVYFGQRANDILLVENVENTLKDYIQLAFSSQPNGQALLDQAIQSMTSSMKSPVTFDDLALGQYIALFLHKNNWSRFEEVLELGRSAVAHLLDGVRKTRNNLAHFREISRDQSRQLRDCYDLLVSHQEAFTLAFAQHDSIIEQVTLPNGEKEPDDEVHPVEDEPTPGESKYAALAIWLQGQPPDKELVQATFAKIEEIIGGTLPDSAYKNRAWWTNDLMGHVQSKWWLDVGWRVAGVNMTTQIVRFARIAERQKAYIEFFSALDNELREQPGYEHLQLFSDGSNWHYIKSIAIHDRNPALWLYSFGRGGVFRVELYIDSGDQSVNKQIFDALHAEKESIESETGYELLWQRLDNRRASRVSRVFKGQITDSVEELEALRKKAVPAMVSLSHVLEPRVKEIGQRLV